jgi:hypothetical protein
MNRAGRRKQEGWTERHVGASMIREFHGEARIVEGAQLVGANTSVDAIRVGGVPGTAVWVRRGAGALWRRGRLAVTSTSVEFRDEPAATEGVRSDLPPPTGDMLLKAAILASAGIRAKAVASEVYANLLYVTLTSTVWHDDVGHRAEPSDREVDDLIATLTGRGFSWVAARFMIEELIDARVLDEEIAGDIAVLGWRPAV